MVGIFACGNMFMRAAAERIDKKGVYVFTGNKGESNENN